MENNDNESGRNQVIWIGGILFFGVILFGVGRNMYDAYYWEQGSAETCAVIKDFVGKDINNSTQVFYEFTVNKVKFAGNAQGPDFLDNCDKTKECLGRRFRVMYATKNPSVNTLYFDSPCLK